MITDTFTAFDDYHSQDLFCLDCGQPEGVNPECRLNGGAGCYCSQEEERQ